MIERRVRVTISDSKLIPTIGKGPINRPIAITVGQYEMLKKFGFNIKIVEESVAKIEKVDEVQESTEETVVVEPEVESEEEVVEEAPVEEVEESTDEVSDEVAEEEVVEEAPVEESTDVAYTEEELEEATKKELKEILDERNVEYKYNATVAELRELALSSNPV